MLRLPLLALALAAAPAAAVSSHDWIDRLEAPFRIEGVEVRFHPLAAAGAGSGVAADLIRDIAAAQSEWRASGRPVRARITIEGLKWASAAVAIVGGTSDNLGGLVELLDPASGERLGRLYVDVFLSHGGLLGMAVRGDGEARAIREFAEELARAATGRKRP